MTTHEIKVALQTVSENSADSKNLPLETSSFSSSFNYCVTEQFYMEWANKMKTNLNLIENSEDRSEIEENVKRIDRFLKKAIGYKTLDNKLQSIINDADWIATFSLYYTSMIDCIDYWLKGILKNIGEMERKRLESSL